MAFSTKAARENKQMFDRALTFWRSSGYNPADTPRGSSWQQIEHLRPYLESVQQQMENEFPDIPSSRIRSQVMRAKTKIYSQWVRCRGNNETNNR